METTTMTPEQQPQLAPRWAAALVAVGFAVGGGGGTALGVLGERAPVRLDDRDSRKLDEIAKDVAAMKTARAGVDVEVRNLVRRVTKLEDALDALQQRRRRR